MIAIGDLSGKASISVRGFPIDGYQLLSKINCKIPNIYWYSDNFMRVVIMVIERIMKPHVNLEIVDLYRGSGPIIISDKTVKPQVNMEFIDSSRCSDFTMDVTVRVLEDMARFHKHAPDVKKDPEIETDVELFVDAMVMEVSMFAERECIPPANSKVTRIYIDGGILCVDFEVS